MNIGLKWDLATENLSQTAKHIIQHENSQGIHWALGRYEVHLLVPRTALEAASAAPDPDMTAPFRTRPLRTYRALKSPKGLKHVEMFRQFYTVPTVP